MRSYSLGPTASTHLGGIVLQDAVQLLHNKLAHNTLSGGMDRFFGVWVHFHTQGSLTDWIYNLVRGLAEAERRAACVRILKYKYCTVINYKFPMTKLIPLR